MHIGRRTVLRPVTVTVAALVAVAGLRVSGCMPGSPASPGPPGGAPNPLDTRAAPALSPPAESNRQPVQAPDLQQLVEVSGPLKPEVAGEITTGLNTPWGLVFLPDGNALVSERNTGNIVRVTPEGTKTLIGTVPGVQKGGEGGLLGIAVHPNYPQEPFLYAYFTSGSDNRIIRCQLTGDGLGEPQVLVQDIPKGGIHNGGRLLFGPDGMLYAGTGETGNSALAQDKSSLGGKILRMTPDGAVPPDNPFSSLVWTWGHRNVQGLGFDAKGRLWASELGQSDNDELNLIEKGKNYGWPELEGTKSSGEFTGSELAWNPAEASPSGIAVAGGNIFVANMRGRRLIRVTFGLESGRVIDQAAFFQADYGRLRTITAAPDGTLWLTTSNTDQNGGATPTEGGFDKILRLSLVPPAES